MSYACQALVCSIKQQCPLIIGDRLIVPDIEAVSLPSVRDPTQVRLQSWPQTLHQLRFKSVR